MAKKKEAPPVEAKSQEQTAPSAHEALPAETRGRKPKELSIADVQDAAKELILKIRDYSDIKKATGKNVLRLNTASSQIQMMLRTHLID